MASTTKASPSAGSRRAAIQAALEEPVHHSAAPRLGLPDQEITSIALGRPMTLRADEHGIIRPADADEVRLADLLSLTVLRSVDQEADVAPAPTPAPAIRPSPAADLRLRALELDLTLPAKATRAALASAIAAEESRLTAGAAAAEAAFVKATDDAAAGDAEPESEES